jgi:hypothetical protein
MLTKEDGVGWCGSNGIGENGYDHEAYESFNIRLYDLPRSDDIRLGAIDCAGSKYFEAECGAKLLGRSIHRLDVAHKR